MHSSTENSAEITQPANSQSESDLMLEAVGKATDAMTAQLDGNQENLEKAVSDAVAIYDQVLGSNPNNIKAINGKAALKEMLGSGKGADDYKIAIEMSSKAIEQNSADADAYFNRATAYRGLKQYTEARSDFEKAIELNPNRFDWPLALRSMNAEAGMQ